MLELPQIPSKFSMNEPFLLKIAVLNFLPHSLLPLRKHHKLLPFEPYASAGQEERAAGGTGETHT